MDEAREEMSATIPAIGVQTFLRTWAARDGVPAETSTIVEEVTGSPARPFARWATDHVPDFR